MTTYLQNRYCFICKKIIKDEWIYDIQALFSQWKGDSGENGFYTAIEIPSHYTPNLVSHTQCFREIMIKAEVLLWTDTLQELKSEFIGKKRSD